MYVYIATFNVKKGEEITFVELQEFDENTDSTPAGLNHYHIFKDINEEGRFFVLEYWDRKEDKDKHEMTEMHKEFHKLREPLLSEPGPKYECEKLV